MPDPELQEARRKALAHALNGSSKASRRDQDQAKRQNHAPKPTPIARLNLYGVPAGDLRLDATTPGPIIASLVAIRRTGREAVLHLEIPLHHVDINLRQDAKPVALPPTQEIEAQPPPPAGGIPESQPSDGQDDAGAPDEPQPEPLTA